MKATFVHDAAYTCRDLAPHLNDLGVETEFIRLQPVLKLAREIRKSRSDIIHANYLRSPAYAAFLSFRRPYILHCHGDDIRHGLSFLQKVAIRSASQVLYSTEDLKGIIKGSVRLPQPVDISRFHPMENTQKQKAALYFVQTTTDSRLRTHENEHIENIAELCKKKGIALNVRIKVKEPIPYEQMPEYLSSFMYLFDRELPLSDSKIALECMAMKVPVISFDMEKNDRCFELAESLVEKRHARILEINASSQVAKALKQIYLEVLGES
jgi:hypothetical protein